MLSRSIPHFSWSSIIPAPLDEVWAFHERPEAIETLTPPAQRLRLISRQGGLERGSIVVFRLTLWGPLGVTWVAEHTDYRYRQYFVDEQREGPFHFWRHTHRFEAVPEGTRLTDSIDYQAPLGPFSAWVVEWQLRRLFRWRHAATRAAVAGR